MRRPSPARLSLACVGVAAVGTIAVACASNDAATLETLPPVRTTTSTTTTTVPPTTRPETYEIQPGEGLFNVAEKFGISLAELAVYNGIENPDYVQAGQVIRLPPVDPEE